MAAVLETHLRQAQAEPMAPIDLVSCLVSDELQRRADRLFERRRKQAGFRDGNKTLDNFDFSLNPKMNRSLIFDLATCRFITQREMRSFSDPMPRSPTRCRLAAVVIAEGEIQQFSTPDARGEQQNNREAGRLRAERGEWLGVKLAAGLSNCATSASEDVWLGR